MNIKKELTKWLVEHEIYQDAPSFKDNLSSLTQLVENLIDHLNNGGVVNNIPEYDPNFGDNKKCACGDPYYRHFDSYADMEPVGCKYCPCEQFEAFEPIPTKVPDKSDEILKMLNYLTKKYNIDIHKRSEGIFDIDTNAFKLSDGRNCQSITINFNIKKLTAYAYDESGHNGDHYNCLNEKLNWDKLLIIYDSLSNLFKNQIEIDLEKERLDKVVNERFNSIINGSLK